MLLALAIEIEIQASPIQKQHIVDDEYVDMAHQQRASSLFGLCIEPAKKMKAAKTQRQSAHCSEYEGHRSEDFLLNQAGYVANDRYRDLESLPVETFERASLREDRLTEESHTFLQTRQL